MITVNIPEIDVRKIRFSADRVTTYSSSLILGYGSDLIQVPVSLEFTPAITINPMTFTYSGTGTKYEAKVNVKYDDTDLVLGTDYTIVYTDNKGTVTENKTIRATATITGKGGYSGNTSRYFTIKTVI